MPAKDMRKATYKLWYAFMKRSNRNNWSDDAELYFDNIDDVTFSEWWEEWKDHTEVISESGIDVMRTVKQFEEYNDGRGVIVWISLFEPKKKILNSIRILIDEILPLKSPDLPKKTSGRTKFALRDSSADLRLAQSISENGILALGKMLKVYDACIAADIKKAKGKPYENRYEIGKRLGISPAHVWEAGDLNKKEKINKMNATVSRYYRWAKEIIENAEKGIFPKHS